ncbi:MAG: hypothetical protein K8I02_11290, partial [Candidatus Methylomirabilis sp.]|nr:hypothetical protein [Deltaproteobacteria bacterium]
MSQTIQRAVLLLGIALAAPAQSWALRSTPAVLASALGDDERLAQVTGYVSDPFGRIVFRVVFHEIDGGAFSEDAIFFRDGPLIAPVALQGYEADAPKRRFASRAGAPVFSNPSLNPNGHAVFAARYEDAGKSAGRGLFLYDGAYLSLALGAGAEVPGAGAALADFGEPSILASGALVFSAFYDDANDGGRYAAADAIAGLAGGELLAFARIGDPAPGMAGVFAAFGTPRTSPNGSAAFWAQVRDGAETTQAIFLHKDGALAPVVRLGDAAPGADALFTTLRGGEISVNDAGQVAFAACWADCFTRSGVFRASAEGGVDAVAIFRPGDLLTSFIGAGSPAITASGAVYFMGVQATDGSLGVFLASDLGVQSVAVTGEPISGEEAHGLFG